MRRSAAKKADADANKGGRHAHPTKHVEHANVNAIRADACADEDII
jgi:hypothetical protein